MNSQLFPSYKQLYEQQRQRAQQLEVECDSLRRKVQHLERTISRLKLTINNESSLMKENQAKVANSPLKPRSHINKFAQITGGANSTEKKRCRQIVIHLGKEGEEEWKRSLLHLGRAYRQPNSLWEFEFCELPECYQNFDIGYIKELVSLNNVARWDSPYLLELQCFRPLKKCYLSVYPQQGSDRILDCFLSPVEPNLRHFQDCLRRHKDVPNQSLMHSPQSKQIFIRQLYTHFQTHLPFSIEWLVLNVMLDRSLVVRGSDHSEISMLIYLIRNAVDIELPHILNYNLTDEILLEAPAPFLYGLVDSELEVEPHQHTMLLDLEIFSLAPRPNQGLFPSLSDVVETMEVLLPYRSLPTQTLEARLLTLPSTKPTIDYLRQFIRTTTFRNLAHKPTLLIGFPGIQP